MPPCGDKGPTPSPDFQSGWYGGALILNAARVNADIATAGTAWTWQAFAHAAWSMERPVLPAPHQVVKELVHGVFGASVFSPRSLVYHAAITLETAAVEGFWSIFKRGVVGTFHKVSKKYLPL